MSLTRTLTQGWRGAGAQAASVADNGVGSINAGGLAAMLDAYKVGFYRPNEIPIELQRGGQHQRGRAGGDAGRVQGWVL